MKITWYGHSAFRLEIKEAVLLIDPFISGNETCPVSAKEAGRGATHILLSHGHSDHFGDTVEIAKDTGAMVIANFEVTTYAESKGVKQTKGMNPGGEIDLNAFRVAMTHAIHSSSAGEDGKPIYLGAPAGLVVMAKSEPTLYHAGDTEIFSDMTLIEEFYRPQIGCIPVGDIFTMGARKAAVAVNRYFNFESVIPIHYATFPMLDQTPDKFLSEMKDSKTNVLAMKPGETIDVQAWSRSSAMRGAA